MCQISPRGFSINYRIKLPGPVSTPLEKGRLSNSIIQKVDLDAEKQVRKPCKVSYVDGKSSATFHLESIYGVLKLKCRDGSTPLDDGVISRNRDIIANLGGLKRGEGIEKNYIKDGIVRPSKSKHSSSV